MALHKGTAKAASTLARLKSKKAQLELKTNQLAARKSDVEAKADQLGRSLKRTIDTREKILLGALVKMVGLDRFTLSCQYSNQTEPIGDHNVAVMTTYDLDLIIGALWVLSEQLNGAEIALIDGLRRTGREFRSRRKRTRTEPQNSPMGYIGG